MNFDVLTRTRKSTDKFDPTVIIDDESIRSIVEIATQTPSGYNAQPWQVLAIRNPEKLSQIQEIAFGQKKITESGCCFLIVGDTEFSTHERARILAEMAQFKKLPEAKIAGIESSLKKNRSIEQRREMVIRAGSMFASFVILAAHELGWNTCPMMGFSQKKLSDILDLPSHQIPVLLIPIGKSLETSKGMPRKSVDEILQIID